jgi:non-specific serine/threonine protein kinase
MIAEKNQLAGDIIKASGEGWITELDNEQLLKLLSLGGI